MLSREWLKQHAAAEKRLRKELEDSGITVIESTPESSGTGRLVATFVPRRRPSVDEDDVTKVESD